jgi:membrane-associated phospholipid phosphatase
MLDAARQYQFIDYATQGYLATVGLLILFFQNDQVPFGTVLLTAHAVGIMALHALITAHGAFPDLRFIRFLRHFYPIMLYTVFYRECEALNLMIIDHYLDLRFIHLEEHLFGLQPSVHFMEALPTLVVSEFLYAAYFSYYLMIAGVGWALYRRNRQQFFHFIAIVSLVFYVCYTIYIFLPVVGPPVFYSPIPGFPAQEKIPFYPLDFPPAVRSGFFFQVMQLIYRYFEGHGAAFPSSHVAVAICTLYFTWRYLPRGRYLHLSAVVALCVATVYCRYHYAVDVPAGVLTAVILIPLGEALYRRLPDRSPAAGAARGHSKKTGMPVDTLDGSVRRR